MLLGNTGRGAVQRFSSRTASICRGAARATVQIMRKRAAGYDEKLIYRVMLGHFLPCVFGMAEMFACGIVQSQKNAILGSSGADECGPRDESERYRKGKNMAQSLLTRCSTGPTVWHHICTAGDVAMRRVKVYRAYRRTLRDLSDLSGHELADLGLHRSEIRRVAHDSVYGARR
jgi:uncharacterized protein YjiS (DUF1127 family)